MPLPEYSYNPSCGNFGVHVTRAQSEYTDSASIGVQYDAYVDYEHTVHRVFVPWDGGRVSVADVQKLLDAAHVPAYVQDVSAVSMILQCVDEIRNDQQNQQPGFSSVLARISTDQETDLVSEDDDDTTTTKTDQCKDQSLLNA